MHKHGRQTKLAALDEQVGRCWTLVSNVSKEVGELVSQLLRPLLQLCTRLAWHQSGNLTNRATNHAPTSTSNATVCEHMLLAGCILLSLSATRPREQKRRNLPAGQVGRQEQLSLMCNATHIHVCMETHAGKCSGVHTLRP
jgi:hypothetical protein